VRGIEPASASLGSTSARPDRLANCLSLWWPEVGVLEEAAREVAGRLRDDDAVGLREPLQSRRDVGRFAHGGRLFLRSFADPVADDDEAGRNADPHAEPLAVPAQLLDIQSTDRVEHVERASIARPASFSCARG
jgi:hypothetical protein